MLAVVVLVCAIALIPPKGKAIRSVKRQASFFIIILALRGTGATLAFDRARFL
jgi:hypothetical protein